MHELIINPVIYAELPRPALFLASRAFVNYRCDGGKKNNVLADFFIGAHAAVLSCAILTHDGRRYRNYFSEGGAGRAGVFCSMVSLVTRFGESIVTLTKVACPGGICLVVAKSLLLKLQPLISRRSRDKSCRSRRFSSWRRCCDSTRRWSIENIADCSPPPESGTSHARSDRLRKSSRPILEMKLRNPRFGNQRIAEQISHAFGVLIDKDVVRRVLAKHYGPDHPGASGPSWLTFLAQAKDSLWSVDLFRCESILLRSHWVLFGHRCVHPPHHRIRYWRRIHRRSGSVPHVQSVHCRPCTARSDQYES